MSLSLFEIGNLMIGGGILLMLLNMNRKIGYLSAKVEVLEEKLRGR